jgi:hypothetical protein
VIKTPECRTCEVMQTIDLGTLGIFLDRWIYVVVSLELTIPGEKEL